MGRLARYVLAGGFALAAGVGAYDMITSMNARKQLEIDKGLPAHVSIVVNPECERLENRTQRGVYIAGAGLLGCIASLAWPRSKHYDINRIGILRPREE